MAGRPMGPAAFVVEEEVFALVIALEIQKAVRLQYPVSLLAILPKPEVGAEMGATRPLAEQLSQVIRATIRGTDLIGVSRRSPALQVLLVDAAFEHLPAVAQRVSDEVRRHRFRLNGGSESVRLAIGAACFPTTATSLDELRAQAEARAREGEGR